MTERERLVGRYIAIWERWNALRLGRVGKSPRYPWAYRAGLHTAMTALRQRIDMLDQERLAA